MIKVSGKITTAPVFCQQDNKYIYEFYK